MLTRVIARYGRIDLLCLDELGYIELDRRGAELLFQVFTEREEKSSIAVASNAAFSEWAQAFTDPRLCAAIVDRLTYDAHIITTGTGSYRLRSATARHQAAARQPGRKGERHPGHVADQPPRQPPADGPGLASTPGIARDIVLMLADARTVLNWLASGAAPAAARQGAAAVLDDADSPYALPGLAGAVGETEGMLHRAVRDALAGVPATIPGT